MKRIISLALCFLLTFTLWQPVFALVDLELKGVAGDGSWYTEDNQDPAQVPENGDTVNIPVSSVVEYSDGESPSPLDRYLVNNDALLIADSLRLSGAEGDDETETVWEVVNATELENALNGFQSGDTVKLNANFTYYKGLVIDGKDITFDTNSFKLTVYNDTQNLSGVGLEVKNGGNVYLIGSGQFDIRQEGGNGSYGVKVTGGSTAIVTNVWATVFQNDAAVGAFAKDNGSSIHILGNVRVVGVSGYGAKTAGQGSITVDGTITAMNYIKIDNTDMDEASGVNDPVKPGYLKYCTDPVTGIVWVKAPLVTVPSLPQNFTATPGDGQIALSWSSPESDGGSAILKYQVSQDSGANWMDTGLDTSHTFTGLTNGTEYTFKVRAVNSAGPGAEASVVATPSVPEFAGGKGTEEDPYLIETVDQLNNVRNYLGTDHSDKHFKLNANLNLDVAPYNSGAGWEPIGTKTNYFTGSFDGGGHTISNLFIKQDASYMSYVPVGLFRYTGAGAEIHDLVLEDVDVTGCYYAGSLVGINNGEITEVNSRGEVVGEWETGGLVGRNRGSISNSCFTGTVTGTDVIEYGEWTGGLVGNNYGTITNCWTDATVFSENDCIGGLVGENYQGTITESYSSGTITGWDYVGGLVGMNSEGDITACYSTCTVNGDGEVGGLVGVNDGWITTSFAVGVVNGNSSIGGLVGKSYETTGTDCYWNTETSGQNKSACGTGKSTSAMKEQATYQGWDFDGVWDINGRDNNGYPFLRWQRTEAAPTVPTAPQNFTATPGDGQVALSWVAPVSGGGSDVIKYQVSKDNGASWTDVGLNTDYTFTGLTNGTEYTFKVRAVNSVGNGEEASAAATPEAVPVSTHTVNFFSNGSLYASKTVASGSALGANWPVNPMRNGYRFGGWFSGENGVGTEYTSETIITADVDLYAKWTYIVSGGGGGGSSAPRTTFYKAAVKTESGMEKELPITVDRNTGTASLGWDPWIERPQGKTVINIPSIPDVGTFSVSIPVPDLSTTDAKGTLALNTGMGSITVPSNMLTGVAGTEGNNAQISIGWGDKSNLPEDVRNKIGNRPLIQLNLSIDGKQIHWSNPNSLVSVSIPYKPTAAELSNPEGIVIWYIDGKGNAVPVPNGQYDPKTGTVFFTTTHFSYYAVSYHRVNFKDVPNDKWYAPAVSFISAREITTGTGDGHFSPEGKLTRSQFIVMLMKAYDIAPDLNPKDNFADAGNTYYTSYLAAAKRLGISAGVGNNMYAPGKEISRQEMFALLYNALKVIGQLPQGNSGKTLLDFSDASHIASWAKEAMSNFVGTGTVGGSGGKLNPTGAATRAEMTQVLYNLLVK